MIKWALSKDSKLNQHTKSIRVNHHINRLKKKNQMIILLNIEKII